MIELRTVAELRAEVARRRGQGGPIAFVPTMGNLHAGHLRLVQEAHRCSQTVIASIYVNPLQFGPREDFATYPRTPEKDRAALDAEGTHVLFMPADSAIYPRGLAQQTIVEVPGLSDILCGASRPGHFRGVTGVVNRLFNLVTPDIAVFGKKDYQQLLLIRRMVLDLRMRVEVLGVETVREPDGLALSSRNNYLTTEERKIAPQLYAVLRETGKMLATGSAGFAELERDAMRALQRGGFRPDHVSIRRQSDLAVPQVSDRELVILAAAWLGRTRLIDNLEVNVIADV